MGLVGHVLLSCVFGIIACACSKRCRLADADLILTLEGLFRLAVLFLFRGVPCSWRLPLTASLDGCPWRLPLMAILDGSHWRLSLAAVRQGARRVQPTDNYICSRVLAIMGYSMRWADTKHLRLMWVYSASNLMVTPCLNSLEHRLLYTGRVKCSLLIEELPLVFLFFLKKTWGKRRKKWFIFDLLIISQEL